MPNLNDIINEANAAGNGYDIVRKKYLEELQRLTRRNVIVYYSGWLQKPSLNQELGPVSRRLHKRLRSN
jgi:hypothetical protein